MQIRLDRTEDPRTPLEKAHRHELYAFAAQNGVTEIRKDMPADLMRRILLRHGLTHITLPDRPLGQTEGRAIVPTQLQHVTYTPPGAQRQTIELSADDLLERQYAEQMAAPVEETPAPKRRGRPRRNAS